MKKKISVIVPIYNVEKYLKKCIDSIIFQTYRDFELILVDDGSTDRCPEICDDYAKKYDYIRVIHKKNGGLSDARNVGICNSKCNYITFIDADDYINPHFLEIMLDAIIKYSADIVISGLNNCYEDQKIVEQLDNVESNIFSKEQVYKKILMQDGIDVSANAKLYKKEIFKDIKYPVGQLYEDIQIIDKIIERCNKIVITTYLGYNYLQRSGSIMYSKMSDDRLVLLDKAHELLEFINKNYPNISNAAIRRYIYCNFHILGRSILSNEYLGVCKKIRKDIMGYKKNIFFDNIYSKKEKLATFVLIFGLRIYKLFWKLYCIKQNKGLV